jgi:hypothetical protein
MYLRRMSFCWGLALHLGTPPYKPAIRYDRYSRAPPCITYSLVPSRLTSIDSPNGELPEPRKPDLKTKLPFGNRSALPRAPVDAGTTDIAIVVEKQRILIQIVHIMLVGKPWTRIGGVNCEIPSDESVREEIYVQPLPALGHKWRLSVDGGEEPRWSSDGRQLFFRHGDRMMAVDIPTKSTLKPEGAHLLFEGPYVRSDFWSNYDVAVDGQRFVMLREEDEARTTQVLSVVLNWVGELESHSGP